VAWVGQLLLFTSSFITGCGAHHRTPSKRAGKPPLSTGDDGSEDRAGVTAEDLSFWAGLVSWV